MTWRASLGRIVGAMLSFAALGAAPAVYRNPVLPGDYSDPDAIRVGTDFYLTASSFTNVPGLPILHSKDLVHWQIVGHALPALSPSAHYRVPRHGGGVWAPAIRHHDGKFVIYYPDPDYGIFRVEAADPAGPWSAPVLVDASKGAIDPCPFWDDDGTGWLVHAWARSRAGFSNVLTLKRLSADGTKTVGEGIPIVNGAELPPTQTSNGPMAWLTTEGPKLYKRDGWYYVFAPSGSVNGGWQGVFRSRKIDGPYEGRDVLDQGSTDVNGPHQGAWVTTASGEDWFLHFQDTGSYGRRVWLEPMAWKDGWPVIGVDEKHLGRGEPVLTWRLPRTDVSSSMPQDDFSGRIGPAWQWNANPADDWADVTSVPGRLRLHSVSQPENLWENGAILTHKLPGERFSTTVKVFFSPKAIGEETGLAIYGKGYAWIGLKKTPNGMKLVTVVRPQANENGPETEHVVLANAPATVWLGLVAEPVRVAQPPPSFSPFWPSMLQTTYIRIRFQYSTDPQNSVSVGDPIDLPPGVWVGSQVGIFSVAPSGTPAFVATETGWADYDGFRFDGVRNR